MKKRILFLFGLSTSLICFFVSYSAVASDALITDAHIIKNKIGVDLELSFESPYASKGLKPAYERNFIQFVLGGVGVKSARMIPVGAEGIDKIFIYQYQPGVARVRFITKDGTEVPKGRITIWNSKNTSIRFRVKNPTAVLTKVHNNDSKPILERLAADEERLLKDVVREPESVTSEPIKISLTGASATTASIQEQVGIKAEPSRHFVRMILALLAVIGLFVGVVLVIRRYADRMDIGKLPFGKKERLIQVVASHRLGKSQAITLVKVTGEYMVMGVCGDNIQLIAKLGREIDVEKYIDDRHWGGVLEKHIKDLEKPKYNFDGARDVSVPLPAVQAVASAFRTAIKEKITHLKPLS